MTVKLILILNYSFFFRNEKVHTKITWQMKMAYGQWINTKLINNETEK